jgi:hypothetical protein
MVTNNRAGFGPLATVTVLVLCLLVTAWLQVDFSHPDEWRRTAHGWERSNPWLVASGEPVASMKASPSHSSAKMRFDTHPIVLAFAQVVGTLLALLAAAPGFGHPQHVGVLSAISRSFRASVFGS